MITVDNTFVEIKSKLDYESYRNFVRFTLFRGKGYKIGPVSLFITLPILILLTLFMGIFSKDTLSIILCISLFVLLLLMLNLYFIMPKISYKKSTPLLADEVIHRFYENHLEVDAIGENVKGADTYQYTVFKMIYEVNSAFYLKMTNGIAFIIPKKYLDAGQIDYLNKFFANRFGDKYKNCY